MKLRTITIMLLLSIVAIGTASATYENGYVVDWNETDEGAFNEMIQPCMNVWNKAPFAMLPVNGNVMQFAEFRELVRANHPDPFMRGEEIRVSKGSSTVTYAHGDVAPPAEPKTLVKKIWIIGGYHEDTAPERLCDINYAWGKLIEFEVTECDENGDE